MTLVERLFSWIEGHGRILLPIVVGAVALSVGVAFVRRLLEPNWTPEQLWKLKKRTIQMLEVEYQGITCAAGAKKLEVPAGHLKVVLEELIQDRFAVVHRERGENVYILKRYQENPVS